MDNQNHGCEKDARATTLGDEIDAIRKVTEAVHGLDLKTAVRVFTFVGQRLADQKIERSNHQQQQIDLTMAGKEIAKLLRERGVDLADVEAAGCGDPGCEVCGPVIAALKSEKAN